MRNLLVSFLIILSFNLESVSSLEFSFSNCEVTHENTEYWYEFDVMIKAGEPDIGLGLGMVLINYSELGFGTFINENNNVLAAKESLIDNGYYQLIINDNQATRLAIVFDFNTDEQYASIVPTTPTKLLHVKFRIQNLSATSGLSFYSDDMQGQNYYADNTTKFDPVIASDTDDSTLPVVLANFTANYQNNKGLIQWTTQSENSNAGWNIYRAPNNNLEEAFNINFELIPGAGNSSIPIDYSYEDVSDLLYDKTYWYWLESISNDGNTTTYGPISLTIPDYETNPNTPDIPHNYGLQQNYPNPFNPTTEISFTLSESSPVILTIYNLKGRKIRNLLENVTIEKDEIQHVVWDGKDEAGQKVTSGIYLCKLLTRKHKYMKKMILLK